jgi:hypothetical protein
VAIATAAILAPAASASITPSLTLVQSGGTTAGSTVNLGTDLKFAPTGGDSPKDLTLSLPAGLLANAAIDGGACLRTSTPIPACQVGSGTATAAPVVLGVQGLPISLPVTFDLVAPPQPGDLAGLALQATSAGQTSQLGAPADITVRSSSDPAGVGLNVRFNGIPNTFALGGLATQIAVDELNSTLTGVRLPTSCPATPANVSVTADSYDAPTVSHTATAPLHVTGCSSLPFTPSFHLSATKDAGDDQVQIVTQVTQPAKPAQSTSRSVALTIPSDVLTPNVPAAARLLCADLASGKCQTVGTASSTSPLYPTPLVGKAYLTGELTAPELALVFPPPFSLTLFGDVSLATSTTTFSGVPDIPLTNLSVTLAGGPNGLFQTSCTPSSGTAKATLIAQDGDRSVVASSPFTVSRCSGTGSGGSGGSGSGGSGGNHQTVGRPLISSASLSGLARGVPRLSFTLLAGRGAPGISSFTIKLPSGLSFRAVRRQGRLHVAGVSIAGARVKSLALSRGRLIVTLRRAVRKLSIKLGPRALKETSALKRAAAAGRLHLLTLSVVAKDAAGHATTLALAIRYGR